MLLLRSRSRLLDTQMRPQPFCEYGNIVPHWRTSGCTQFVEVRPVSTVPPRAECIQGYGEPLGYLVLIHEFREIHVCLFALSPVPLAHSSFGFCHNPFEISFQSLVPTASL